MRGHTRKIRCAYHMKKKNPVTRAGYFSKNPTLASLAIIKSQGKKILITVKKTGEKCNQENRPHPAESLPPAGEEDAARHGRRRISRLGTGEFKLTGEVSSRIAGLSCLPQIKFPLSLTAPIGLVVGKLAPVVPSLVAEAALHGRAMP